ncbi:MAG TPA: SBBP repeat-containing protein, partial [Anaerolineales bacterium]|nr:SBBP repeat-containing protein [Anaerolineales bacterium]
TGAFMGTVDFDPGVNTFNLIAVYEDIFVVKFDADGNFLWAKSMGGVDAYTRSSKISIDSYGNVYTTGYFGGTVDFDPGAGVYNLTSSGDIALGYGDGFISKLDENGNFVWARNVGGLNDDSITGSALDANGNIYTSGSFVETADFDPGVGTYNLTSEGGSDIFVSKLDANGDLVWAKRIGGSLYDYGGGVAIDLIGNVFLTGSFIDTVDFDPNAGAYILTSTGAYDPFVVNLSNDGNFVWAVSMGGAGWDYGGDIAIDSNNNVYTTGVFEDIADFDPGAGIFNLTSMGGRDIYISKLDDIGNFVWAKSIGGVGFEFISDIALDQNGNVYTTGAITQSADFDPGIGNVYLPSQGDYDVFVSKLDNSGNYVFAKTMGGDAEELAFGIAVGANSEAYVTGRFQGTADFDPTQNISNLTSVGETDIFISKLDNSPSSVPTFGDVHFNHPKYKYIQALYDGGFTAGCSTDPLMFCPDLILDRAQSAVFMLRGQLGSGYTPPPAPWNTFLADSWVGFEYVQPWAEGMWQEGLTKGCQSDPLKYCPETQLPRVEASVFGLRMKYGVNYTPPAASGTLFADFPSTDPSYWAIDWAEQAYNDGLLPACGTDSATGKPMFCPSQLVDRGWGAYLIVKAKNLPLP